MATKTPKAGTPAAKAATPRAPRAAKPAAPAKVIASPEPVEVATPAVVAAPVEAPAPVPTPTIPTPTIPTPTIPTPVATVAVPVVITPAKQPTQTKVNLMENTIQATTEKAQAMFADLNDRAKAAMEKGNQLFTEMNELSKGHVEAIVESSKIAAKGIETMGQDAAEYTRKSFEGATAAMRTLASAKTPAEFMKLQSDFFRTTFDNLVAETSKTSEAVLKLVGEVAQPISNRVAVAAEKLKVAA